MKEVNNMKKILQTYIQYSKRIAIFGIVQWAVLSVLIIGVVCLSVFTSIEMQETVSSLLKNIITSSSALAIAISSGYFAHSAYDNTLKQRVNTFSAVSEEDDGNG